MIGGNINAVVQIKSQGDKNEIGERESVWFNALKLHGWLDFMSGEAKYTTFNAKVEESSHLFICDYKEDITKLCCLLDGNGDYIFDSENCVIRTRTSSDGEDVESATSENGRMIVDGRVYDIVFIDDPMHLHQQYEFYLKATGNYGK